MSKQIGIIFLVMLSIDFRNTLIDALCNFVNIKVLSELKFIVEFVSYVKKIA